MTLRVLIGYDGSLAAGAAIDAGARLFPRTRAWIAHVWTPPFASTSLRHRLWSGTANINEFVAALEREGRREATRLADTGVTLAAAVGWEAEPLVVRSYGGEGLQLAELAEQENADVLLIGSRGLGGARAVLGSASDLAVHYSTRPVLVVPHPLLMDEYAALGEGSVLVADDGSAGAEAALAEAIRLFPSRELARVTVDEGHTTHDSDTAPPAEQTPVTRLQVPRGHGAAGRAVAGALSASARSRGAAVIVVGSRGRSALQEMLLGSVAMATLHHAHRPVLVVPPPGRQSLQGIRSDEQTPQD